MFLFFLYEKGVVSGKDFIVFDVLNVGCFGVFICYDMWFFEMSCILMWFGVEVIIYFSLINIIDCDVEFVIVCSIVVIN